jgi:murein L,D-transpeptidase YafK
VRHARSLFRLLLLLLALALGALALLRRMPEPTAPLPPLAGPIDRILVEKAARRLTVFKDGHALRSWRITLGFAPAGDKARQGDGRTPEGRFRIDRRNDDSAFHLSLGLDYPQTDDLIRARTGGFDPGGDIFIHGQPNAWAGRATIGYDWTAGCIALADAEIEELWRVTPLGTPVEIRP